MSHRNWKLALRPRLYGTMKLQPMIHFSGINKGLLPAVLTVTLARPRSYCNALRVSLPEPWAGEAGGSGRRMRLEAGASHSETPSGLSTCDSGPSQQPSQVLSDSFPPCRLDLSSTHVCCAPQTHTALFYFRISGCVVPFTCPSQVRLFYINVPISESPSLTTEMD